VFSTDLSTRSCDGRAVAALARGRRQACGDLVLAAPQREVMLVLAVTRLTDAFGVYATVEETAGAAGHLRERAVPGPVGSRLVPSAAADAAA